MDTRAKTTRAAAVDEDRAPRKNRRKRWSIKSCLAVFLAAVVTVTTIHSHVLYVQAEGDGAADTRTRFTFRALSPEQAVLTLDKKGTLEETLETLPKTLQIDVETPAPDPVIPEDPDPTVSGSNLTGSIDPAGEDVDDTADTGTDNADGQNAGADAFTEGDNGGASDGSSTEEGNGGASDDMPQQVTVPDSPVYSAPGENSVTIMTSDGSSEAPEQGTLPRKPEDSAPTRNTSGASTDTPTEGDKGTTPANPEGGNNGATPTDPENGTDNITTPTDPEGGNNGTTPTDPEGSSNNDMTPADTGADNADILPVNPDTAPAAPPLSDDPGADPEDVPAQELAVSWSCDHYEEIRDSYVFTPTWDNTRYCYAGAPEDIPTITVVFSEIPGMRLVSTEEELRAAFEPLPGDGILSILLTADIPLTQTLYIPELPANAVVTLESRMEENGTAFSLTRGTVSSGEVFSGAMLWFGGLTAAPAADIPTPATTEGGTLTLRNITVDGKKILSGDSSLLSTEANKANAPAIISNGHLILESGAKILNNYNGGTFLMQEDGITPALDGTGNNLYAIPPCGGGLWIQKGTLELRDGCQIRYNTAGLSGGGIYLDTGAVLRCDTESYVLTGNAVASSGIGADLYACAGSTLYYDPNRFLLWNSFYIDPAASLIPNGSPALDTTTPVEIYLHICENSGYSYREVKEKLESAFGDRVTVLMPQTNVIDTTDLRNWYVFDHYDASCWDQTDADGDNIPDSWEYAYREYLHRPYFPYAPSSNLTTAVVKGNEISSWLKELPERSGNLALAPLKEHIYSRAENGKPEMSFVGYDQYPNVDFLFYDPQSDGQKTVEFDVNSSKVNIHTLAGNGFLLDTGITDGTSLSGYLVYYSYKANGTAESIELYRFNGVDIDTLHSGIGTNAGISQGSLVGEARPVNTWESEMSIKITVDSGNITVTQRPKNKPDASPEIFTWNNLEKTGFSGFGPLVAYKPHACYIASSFTYSNLRMQFANPDREKNLLSSLAEADFSQQGNVKRYFLNLLGESKNLNYGGQAGTEFGDQYHEFLYLMQNEGIGLITDAETGFEKYLGPEKISQNLFELPNPDRRADLNSLVASLSTYLSMFPTTELPADLTAAGLQRADAKKPIGNIYLADAGNVQLKRVINANALPPNYIVNIMDIACDPLGVGYEAKYFLLKPESLEYIPLSEEALPAAARLGGRMGASFMITNDPKEWPTGLYTVKQEITDSQIYGYSYFTLTRAPLSEELPPDVPVVVPDRVVSSPAGSTERPEIVALTADTQIIAPAHSASEPKTGDGMFPVMPVACGACTAFMLKIMLWMYDMDFEAVTERKEDTVRSLISWGKGSAKPKICLTIIALTAVITSYHLLKAFYENSRQFVRERFGRA